MNAMTIMKKLMKLMKLMNARVIRNAMDIEYNGFTEQNKHNTMSFMPCNNAKD